MARRSDRMQRVQGCAESEERVRCRAMGEAERQLAEHLERLAELQGYCRDYAGRRPVGGTVSGAQWADFQTFLVRLDNAVATQAAEVGQARRKLDAHRQRWRIQRQKTESLARVVERYRDDEHRERDLQQQKLLDEQPAAPTPFDTPRDA